jgi:hypothetical protein
MAVIFSQGEEAPLSQLGKIGLDWDGVEKFWTALPNREKISK